MRFATVRSWFVWVLAALSAAAAPMASAATDTTTFQVSATIAPDCNLSAAALSFGAYDATSGSALDGASAISVYCSSGTAYSLALNIGSGGGSFTTRTMSGGGGNLGFNLYTTVGRTVVWGDGTGATSTVAGVGTGLLTAANHTVYGRIGAGQDLAAGGYGSTITVTVTF